MSDASKRVRETAVRLFGDGVGCSDGMCVFGRPGGMHTTGGCRCLMGDGSVGQSIAERSRELRRRGMMLSRIAHELAREAGTL